MEAKYERIESKPIGRGSFALVYLVRRKADGRRLAMKVIKIPSTDDDAL
jgi:serine/threonine protein kinase